MIDMYVNIKNSLTGLESALRIAISNANHFNTPGYKYTYSSFTTVYAEAMFGGSDTQNPMHVGSSMALGSTSTDFSQGNMTLGTQMDVAISGEGFFLVSAAPTEFDAGSPKVFSRAGRFQADFSNTYVTDPFGRKVYGYKVDNNGNPTGELEAMKTDGHLDVGFIDGGVLVSNYADAIKDPALAKPMYKVALTTVTNKQGLVLGNGGVYKTTVASGEQLSIATSGEAVQEGSSSTYGDVLPGSLESANIDVAKVALDMNILNRSFSAIQGVMDDVTKILSSLIQKLGG